MGNTYGRMSAPELEELVQAANFTEREVKRMYKRFCDLDTDKDGLLGLQELFTIPIIADNPLAHRVVSVFDMNSDGKVSFIEFIAALAKLSAGTEESQKTRFAFDVYDINKDGYITNGELFQVMKMMVGSNLTDQQLQQLVDRTIIRADTDNDGMISFEEFQEMVSHIDFSEKLQLDANSQVFD